MTDWEKMEPEISYSNGTRSLEGKTKRTKPDRRWTLLFIGDHGRVVTLKRFKGYVFFAVFIFLLAAAAIFLLYWHNQNIIQNNQKLQSGLDILQKRIKALRHEKDILMARLVLAESRVKENIGIGGKIANQDEKPLEAENLKKFSGDSRPIDAEVKKKVLAVKTTIEPDVASQAPKPNLSVDVEDFNIISLTDAKKLNIQFKVKNTSPNSQRVSGHAIVVFKDDQLDPQKWLSIPKMELVDGKPTGQRRGYAFAINYFRTMRFTADVPPSPDQYRTAAVYVFTGDGELLLEKNFPLEFPAESSEASDQSSTDSGQHSMENVLRDFKSTAAQQSPQSPQTGNQPSESGDPSPF